MHEQQREEREALIEIADPVARALVIAAERERREAERTDEISRLRDLLDRVVSHLGFDRADQLPAARSA